VRYILICTNNPDHRRFVERDACTWVPEADLHSLMPQDYLDEQPTPKQLRRYRCQECGATVTLQEEK
jgi:hypothetical protein